MNTRALALALLTATGCSTFSRSNSEAENAAKRDGNARYSASEPATPKELKDEEVRHLESTVTALNSRIRELESRLQANQPRPDHSVGSANAPRPNDRQSFDAAKVGTPVPASVAGNDPGAGMINDAAVRAFQQGRMLFDQEKYPEAILAFSAFLEGNSGHALASSAQYSIGESYYRQGDFAVAEQEFQKLSARYPQSPRASFALVRLSQSASALGKAEDAKRYRAQAEGLFPRSPALKLFRETPPAATNATTGADTTTPIATAPVLSIERPSVPTVPAPTIEAPTVERPVVESPNSHAPRARVSDGDLDAPPGGGG